MADNYLEKRMDDYRSGKLSPSSRRPAGITSRSVKSAISQLRVLVTGGASGIGLAIVEAFRAEGCRVASIDIESVSGTHTSQANGSRFYCLDVSDPTTLASAMDDIFARWGDIDVIVNCAGVFKPTPIEQCEPEEFMKILSVNLLPAYVTSSRLTAFRNSLPSPNPYGGRIINITSTRAFQSEPHTEAYSASKGGLVALTHALMASLAPYNITVNAIAPGWIDTGHYPIREIDKQWHPSGRVGVPHDIARACIWLAHPDSAFINGETITIDGGVTRKMYYPPESE